MNARARIALPTLTPVPKTVACPRCDGLGELTTGQSADGCLHTKPCPDCFEGDVPNADWEMNLCTCPCGHALLPGDSCRTCNAYYSELDA